MTRTPLSTRTVRWLWVAAVTDVMAVVWMHTAGDWFDAHLLTSVITLGGHHQVVLGLAAAGFALIVVIALMTEGFSRTGRLESTVVSVACLISVIALAGFLSMVALVVGVGLFLGLTGRLLG